VDGLPIAVTGDENASVQVWDLTTGTLRAVLTGHEDEISEVATTILDNAPVIVTASRDKTVRIWDLITHDLLTTLHFPAPLTALCTEPAGEIITAVGWDLMAIDRRAASQTRPSTSGTSTSW
jgi:WD40 repeat protein